MVDEQTKRSVETMILCGCELEALISMYPKIPKEDIIHIWNNHKESVSIRGDKPNNGISINCS